MSPGARGAGELRSSLEVQRYPGLLEVGISKSDRECLPNLSQEFSLMRLAKWMALEDGAAGNGERSPT